MAGVKECIRCGSGTQLRPITFKVDGETATWEDNMLYCDACVKDLGWVEVAE
jgi:hypothetical protein